MDTTTHEATSERPSRARGFGRAMTLAVVAALSIGGSSALASDPTPAPAGGPAASAAPVALDPATVEKAFKDHGACLKEHGLDVMTVGPVTTSGPVPAAGTGAGAPVGGGSFRVSVGTLAAPAAGADGPQVQAFAPDPKAEAAFKACDPILLKAGLQIGTITTVDGQLPEMMVNGTGPLLPVENGKVFAGAGAGVAIVGAVGGAPADLDAVVAPMKAYAACMRANDVDIPDPVVDEKAGSATLSFDLDPTSAAFVAADASCAKDGFSLVPPAPLAPPSK